MGWGAGVGIFDVIVDQTYEHLDPALRVGIYSKIIDYMWGTCDCDTWDDSSFLGDQKYIDVERALRNVGWLSDD